MPLLEKNLHGVKFYDDALWLSNKHRWSSMKKFTFLKFIIYLFIFENNLNQQYIFKGKEKSWLNSN